MTQPTLPSASSRRSEAEARRFAAVARAVSLPQLSAKDNGDEALYPKAQPASFTKGLSHDQYGLVDPEMYEDFRTALVTGDPLMGGLSIAAGANQRKWESPLAGVYFNDISADPDAVAMAPAPKLGLSELCAEMATVYAMALTRDIPFEELQKPATKIPNITTNGSPVTIGDLVEELRSLSWFDTEGRPVGCRGHALTHHEKRRRVAMWESPEAGLTAKVLFRGSTPGSKQGPYISQFMLLGTTSKRSGFNVVDGKIEYGLQTTTQAQLVPQEHVDYMTTWDAWLEVQQGTKYDQPLHPKTRRIHTPRDLAGYVHFDALYQAYLNACLIMLGNDVPVDGGNPINEKRPDNSMGFATWGGPHILSLVTEVATRGLRAARRTKFQVHRRARPEVIAARLAQVANGHVGAMDPGAIVKLKSMLSELGFEDGAAAARPGSILDWIAQLNAHVNGGVGVGPLHVDKTFLLPMAFIEGSPMHPAYGAGHATVAGACVTILKAFFDTEIKFSDAIEGGNTFRAVNKQDKLIKSHRTDGNDATLIEELDKLAANISIGRNIAGVHYNSDYYDSLRMGERIAVSLLEEQMLTYHEPVTLTLMSFDGDTITISTDGERTSAGVKVMVNGTAGYADWWVRDVADYGIVAPPAQPGL